MKQISSRALTNYYVTALLIIAVLSTLSHLILSHSLKTHEGYSALINESGRQRMLSQRIAGMAAQWELGDPSARQEMLAALDKFETAHQHLIEASQGNDEASINEIKLYELYFLLITGLIRK